MEQPRKYVPATPLKLGLIRTARNARPHDSRPLRVSLKQWRILHAVIDCGGFAGAARTLHLSQSAISYTIAHLQEQLGAPLLVIEGRKAQLTDTGRALLNRSRQLLRDAFEIEEFAKQDWGTEVALAVDHHFPPHLLMPALHHFSKLGHNLQVRLNEGPPQAIEDALRAHKADLAICSQVPLGFLGDPLLDIEHIAVAHVGHPLSRLRKEVTEADLERYTQIVICHTPHVERHGTLGRRWHVSSFDTALAAVSESLGYAWLPRNRIEKCLHEGTLQALPLSEGQIYRTTLYLIHGYSRGSSLGANRLIELLRSITSTAQDPKNLHPDDSAVA